MPRVSSHVYTELTAGWQYASLPPDVVLDPRALAAMRENVRWAPAHVPGTVASAARANGRDVFRDPPELDRCDHWYGCTFKGAPPGGGARYTLELDGLATLSEVWLNGEKILASDSMFVPHHVDVTDQLREQNELAIRFRSLDRALAQKRPRPRWRTRLCDHVGLRWIRTSLLGRMPGWSPPLHAVGPWRPIRLVEKTALEVTKCTLASALVDLQRRTGRVHVRLSLQAIDGFDWSSAELWVGEAHAAIRCMASGARGELEGELELDGVALWWPHTHGAQPLYPVRVRVAGGNEPIEIELGSVGFRRLELDADAGRFQLQVNGVPVFCRGACWTTTDITTLTGTSEAYDADLARVRAAGMNMLRVSGTLFYESDRFYRRCDELGILVWQDFMFANMDYPLSDAGFAANVDREVEAFLRRTQASPSLAMLCGGSEVEQQVAMLGLPRELWRSPLFDEVLPAHTGRLRPDVPYWRNSPSGGDLPFEANSGVTHYYGVGAYLRPLEDARRAEVTFAAECLAFANVPGDETIARVLGDGQAPVHHPAWKARVPRDVGASWDFEDVRDHYLQRVFGCDPAALRYSELERYLALSRIVTGEVMANTFGEWRRTRSTCQGALVWFYRDLWPGAGLGLLDASGRPKAAYHYVQRALANVAVWFSDEGLNGLHVHVANDAPKPLAGELRLSLHHDGNGTVLSHADLPLELPAFSSRELRLNALLPWFADATRAYRFGPPAHDLVVATLLSHGRALGDALYFPLGHPVSVRSEPNLRAHARRPAKTSADEETSAHWELRIASERLAYAVEIDVTGYEPEHNYIHVPPGAERVVTLAPLGANTVRAGDSGIYNATPSGTIRAINSNKTVKIAFEAALSDAERESAAPRGIP